jgi:hypothetical protein
MVEKLRASKKTKHRSTLATRRNTVVTPDSMKKPATLLSTLVETFLISQESDRATGASQVTQLPKATKVRIEEELER